MHKKHFSKFIDTNRNILHFAAHSHHYWPDVTYNAVIQYWEDSCKYVDDKWNKVFGEMIPKAQNYISEIIGIDNPEMVSFAPNTHEFVVRLLSCLDWSKKIDILTTDSEFHSFSRQISRFEELSEVSVKRVPTEPFDSFEDRFIDEINKSDYDIIYLSHVFYNSSFKTRYFEKLVSEANDSTIFVIDGYHSFMAVPLSLKGIQNRIFFLGGGYKYAMSGEGVCFMSLPKGTSLRPISTGWFSTFGKISEKQGNKINYSDDGFRFWGSTFDPSGLYRFIAVSDWLKSISLTINDIDNHVQNLMDYFVEKLYNLDSDLLNPNNLITPTERKKRGHFLTFQIDDIEYIYKKLREKNIITDYRGNKLRFGFGLYHDIDDIDKLFNRINK